MPVKYVTFITNTTTSYIFSRPVEIDIQKDTATIEIHHDVVPDTFFNIMATIYKMTGMIRFPIFSRHIYPPTKLITNIPETFLDRAEYEKLILYYSLGGISYTYEPLLVNCPLDMVCVTQPVTRIIFKDSAGNIIESYDIALKAYIYTDPFEPRLKIGTSTDSIYVLTADIEIPQRLQDKFEYLAFTSSTIIYPYLIFYVRVKYIDSVEYYKIDDWKTQMIHLKKPVQHIRATALPYYTDPSTRYTSTNITLLLTPKEL